LKSLFFSSTCCGETAGQGLVGARARREPRHLAPASRLESGRDDQEFSAAGAEIANGVLDAATPDLDR